MSLSIKIFVSCHNNTNVANHAFLIPIQVGAALTNERFADMVYDDTGENISTKNRNYCELTAQYWAWKNEAPDYFGFFHYRRYLSFHKGNLADYSKPPHALARPYEICMLPDKETLERHGFDPQSMRKIIEQYDVIAPRPEEMFVTVYDHYKDSDFHTITDLDLVLDIIKEKYPDYLQATEYYMKSTLHYFCNIFVMKKELFYHYANWLFGILDEFDKRKDHEDNQGKDCRVNGYLGERLFGIYYTWLKQELSVRWAELPRVHFEAYPGETDNFSVMKRINRFLPPGTRRRAWAKQLAKPYRGMKW